MFVVEKLSEDDVELLPSLSSSFVSSSYLVCEYSPSSYLLSIGLREELGVDKERVMHRVSDVDVDLIRSCLRFPNVIHFGVKSDGKLVGFIFVFIFGDVGLIKWFSVDDSVSDLGVYKLLLTRVLNSCRFRGVKRLSFFVSNHDYGFILFLKSLGFRVSGVSGVRFVGDVVDDFMVELGFTL